MDDFVNPDWDVVQTSGNCTEIEVDISELSGIDISLELRSVDNAVILMACEE